MAMAPADQLQSHGARIPGGGIVYQHRPCTCVVGAICILAGVTIVAPAFAAHLLRLCRQLKRWQPSDDCLSLR